MSCGIAAELPKMLSVCTIGCVLGRFPLMSRIRKWKFSFLVNVFVIGAASAIGQ